jgi:predicted acyl esterase
VARSGRLRFALNGNGWRFAPGHRIRLELVGRDSPAYRPSNTAFAVDVRELTVALPTRERR